MRKIVMRRCEAGYRKSWVQDLTMAQVWWEGMRRIMRRVLCIYENVSRDSSRKKSVARNGRNMWVRVESLKKLLQTRA